jgi:hypothetical protein
LYKNYKPNAFVRVFVRSKPLEGDLNLDLFEIDFGDYTFSGNSVPVQELAEEENRSSSLLEKLSNWLAPDWINFKLKSGDLIQVINFSEDRENLFLILFDITEEMDVRSIALHPSVDAFYLDRCIGLGMLGLNQKAKINW